jgi:hypothetical protein
MDPFLVAFFFLWIIPCVVALVLLSCQDGKKREQQRKADFQAFVQRVGPSINIDTVRKAFRELSPEGRAHIQNADDFVRDWTLFNGGTVRLKAE